MDDWMFGYMDDKIDIWMDLLNYGQMDGLMKVQMDERMDVQID